MRLISRLLSVPGARPLLSRLRARGAAGGAGREEAAALRRRRLYSNQSRVGAFLFLLLVGGDAKAHICTPTVC